MDPVNLSLNLAQRVCVTLCGDWLMSSLSEHLELMLNGCLRLPEAGGALIYLVVDRDVLSTWKCVIVE